MLGDVCLHSAGEPGGTHANKGRLCPELTMTFRIHIQPQIGLSFPHELKKNGQVRNMQWVASTKQKKSSLYLKHGRRCWVRLACKRKKGLSPIVVFGSSSSLGRLSGGNKARRPVTSTVFRPLVDLPDAEK